MYVIIVFGRNSVQEVTHEDTNQGENGQLEMNLIIHHNLFNNYNLFIIYSECIYLKHNKEIQLINKKTSKCAISKQSLIYLNEKT